MMESPQWLGSNEQMQFVIFYMGDIEFWVICVIENSIKLQKNVLDKKLVG
jgi:hypothetical protein